MKMTKAHYNHVRESIVLIMHNFPNARGEYESKGLHERFRWDALNKSVGSQWVSDNLYPYLNDAHIDTALRRVMSNN